MECDMITVMGLDLALGRTGVGIAQIRRGVIRYAWQVSCTSRVPNEPTIDRIVLARDRILRQVELERPILIVIEGYAFEARDPGRVLGELGGLVKAGIRKIGIPYLVLGPTVIKAASGSGRADKDAMVAAARALTKNHITDHNAADAVMASCVGAAWLTRSIPVQHAIGYEVQFDKPALRVARRIRPDEYSTAQNPSAVMAPHMASAVA